jgi:hypothetical protein
MGASQLEPVFTMRIRSIDCQLVSGMKGRGQVASDAGGMVGSPITDRGQADIST